MLPCLSKQLFNIHCPGCGLQRSVLFIWNGNFMAAFKMYPAIYFLIALTVLIALNFYFKKAILQKGINLLSILTIITILINYTLKF